MSNYLFSMLIARFWDVTGGSITLGGVDYRDIPLNQLMEHINYVTQAPFLFNMSIRENLLAGKPDATEQEVIAAARSAVCDEFITCKDKTLILIAHRLSTIADCDQIAVINAGSVEAVGTHEGLLETSALYRQMWGIHCESVSWSAGSNTEVTSC